MSPSAPCKTPGSPPTQKPSLRSARRSGGSGRRRRRGRGWGRAGQSGGKAPGPRLRTACRRVLSLFDFLSVEPVLGAGWFPRKHVVRLFPAAAFPPAAARTTARRSAPSGEHRAGGPQGPKGIILGPLKICVTGTHHLNISNLEYLP